MRRSPALLLALAALAPGGCVAPPADGSAGRYEAQVPFRTLAGDDVIQLDVFMVERPAGDRCIDREAWELADEQVLKERKSLLEENGLRAGVLGDAPPDGLRALLRSERSCANPRRQRLRAGRPTHIILGPPEARLAFRLRQDGRTADVDFDQAQCFLRVATRLTGDGRLNLQFTPEVRHGEPISLPHPASQGGALHWDVQTEQPTETYAGLGWEMTVAPNTYVAVGTLLDRPDTLGQRAFLGDEAPQTQRLLVLRPGRAPADDGPADGGDGRQPPLALQAGWTAARGSGP